MQAGIPAEKHRATVQFVKRCTVPVYTAGPGGVCPVGTGSLFHIAGRHYLVTAAHVLTELPSGTLALPVDSGLSHVMTLGAHSVLRAERSEHDVALVLLESAETVEPLARSWHFLSEDNLGAVRSQNDLFMIAGYPRSRDKNPRHPGEPTVLVAGMYKQDVLPSSEPFSRDHDLVLGYDEYVIHYPAGSQMPAPRLSGMSGASVWVLQAEQEGELWSPDKQVRVVGIQSGATHGKYIRAKLWTLLWDAFRAIDPHSATRMRKAITRHYKTGH